MLAGSDDSLTRLLEEAIVSAGSGPPSGQQSPVVGLQKRLLVCPRWAAGWWAGLQGAWPLREAWGGGLSATLAVTRVLRSGAVPGRT